MKFLTTSKGCIYTVCMLRYLASCPGTLPCSTSSLPHIIQRPMFAVIPFVGFGIRFDLYVPLSDGRCSYLSCMISRCLDEVDGVPKITWSMRWPAIPAVLGLITPACKTRPLRRYQVGSSHSLLIQLFINNPIIQSPLFVPFFLNLVNRSPF